MVDNNGCVVALGNFDGLHKGHRRVISAAVEKAAQSELRAVVLLFDSHPCVSLGKDAPAMLMTADEQERIIRQMGAECVRIEFSRIMNMECEEFVREILIKELDAKAICCGFNYHFGAGGKGNADTLCEIAERAGLELCVEEALCYKDEPVSSSRIRECIFAGNMADANAMLGENFSYDFEVVGGDRIGRNLGAPTINQHFDQGFIVPLNGVYASKTYVDGKYYSSITNIGIRPTLGKDELRSETYIIDFSGDLYGRKIRVELLKYIRGEKKFSSLEELKQQIKTDCRIAKDGFSAEKIKVNAIFFDFDDTLQSRKAAHRLFCEAFADRYFPETEGEEREEMLGKMAECLAVDHSDRDGYISEFVGLYGADGHPDAQELSDCFNNDYGRYVAMLPDALDVLEEIKQRGYTMGIISNGVSEIQNTKLDAAGIRDIFDVIIISGDMGICKPDRRIFDEACRQSGFSNEECLFIGDHPVNDVQGALNAGMKAVRMNQGYYYNRELDSVIPTIENLRELLELI